MTPLRCLVAFLALVLSCQAPAQQSERPNGLFLVAKPSLTDPNFTRTVVLVTQAEDASTVGIILNRPSGLRLEQWMQGRDIENYRDRIFTGGPVMRQALIAVLRSETAPKAPAFHVLKGIYLTMHPDNIRSLLADTQAHYRLYSGFSGWAPRQLESEFMRDGWYVLPADEATIFRDATEGMWEELVDKAMRRGPRTHSSEIAPMAALGDALQ